MSSSHRHRRRKKSAKKDIILRYVTLPVAFAIVLVIGVTAYFNNADALIDVPDTLPIATFDGNDENVIGTLCFGKKSFDVVEQAEYTRLADCVSFEYGNQVGDYGVGYYLVYDANIKSLNDGDITISVGEDKHSYKYVNSFLVENRVDVISHGVDINKGIVLFYQRQGEGCFSSQYEALVYEEVQ